jgi:formyl-CoA transferase
LGEHTEEVLRDVLGYSPQEIAAIKAAGATEPQKKAAAE